MAQEYSVNGSLPTTILPELIDENGENVNIDSLTNEDLLEKYNIKRIFSLSYDVKKQKKVWDEKTLSYKAVDLSESELQELRKPLWDKIKKDRDDRLEKVEKKIKEQIEKDGRVMTILNLAKQELLDIKLYVGDPEEFAFSGWTTVDAENTENNPVNPDLDYMTLDELNEYKKTDEYLKNWGPET